MSYTIPQGIQVSLDYNPNTGSGVWHKLSDHNRQPIAVTYNLIESTDRMANGTLRKYIVARKFVISADWKDFPTLDSNVVDYFSKEVAITAISGDGSNVTYTTSTPPRVGDIVYIRGAATTEFNGKFTVGSVTSTSFSVSNTKSGTDTVASFKTANAHAGAWIKAFYEGNYANPVYVKLVFAQEGAVQNSLPDGVYQDSQASTGQIYYAYMTTFTYNVTKRRTGANGQGYDYVDLKIEFTEI